MYQDIHKVDQPFFEICKVCLLILTVSYTQLCYRGGIKNSEIGTVMEYLGQVYLFHTRAV